MKAAVFYGPGDIRIVERPKPKIDDNQILVKTLAAGVCSTDLRIFLGLKKRGVRLGGIIGHELAGEIVQVGEKWKSLFKLGQYITVAPVIPCLKCSACIRGMENVCENRTAIGYEYDGAFAEYVVLPEPLIRVGNIFPLPDNLRLEVAALIEPLACVVNSYHKGEINVGEKVLIIGAGFMGLLHVIVYKMKGAKVFVVEPNLERTQVAKSLGADFVVNDISQIPKTQKFLVAVITIGLTKTVEKVINFLERGGILNLFAGFTENQSIACMDVNAIHYHELLLTGSSAARRKDFIEAIEIARTKEKCLLKLVTHKFTLEHLNEALDLQKKGIGIKKIIIFD